MIELENVTKIFKSGALETVALNNVNVSLPTNRKLAILGVQGSGKTTLIRLLAGIEVPSEGVIRRYARTSFPVGFLGGLRKNATGRYQVQHAAEVYGADPAEVLGFIEALPGMKSILQEPVLSLPGQIRLTLGYALGFAIPFDVYLFDNFFAVGDPTFRQLCEAMFQERARTNGVIVATRQIRTARQFADCCAILDKGTITFYEDVATALDLFQSLLSDAPSTLGAVSEKTKSFLDSS